MMYYAGDAVLLSFSRISGGVPATGLAVTVRVVNARTDATLLATSQLSEAATPGLYRFLWSAGVPGVATDCLAIYTVGGKTFHEFFQVDDLRDRIDNADGRAT